MITNNGKKQHLSVIAGKAYSFADTFVLGASSANLDETITDLDFTWGSFPITDSIVDHELQQVIFYGTIPAEMAGEIKEIGLASIDEGLVGSGRPISRTFFFGTEEGWMPAADEEVAFINTGSKMGPESLMWETIEPGQSVFLRDITFDISDSNMVKLAAEADFASTIEISFYSSDTEKASSQFDLAVGENLVKKNFSSFTTTTGFNRQNIIRVELKIISGSATIVVDSLILSNESNGGLVMREIPANPIIKSGGSTMEVEMAVMLSV